ncbi:MAG: hypothetical protein HGA55_05555 [Methanoregulaceae archaeon]|nr:hypothetical protein [Methanoregulaceae archaeon]
MTASTSELTAEEQQAVDFFLEYQAAVRHALRYPKELKKAEEWSRFLVFLRNLDSALCKSTLDRSCLLYRGVEGEYAERLLFLLDIQDGKGSDFIPHILQDPSYVSFSSPVSQALDRSPGIRDPGVVFVYQAEPGHEGLVLGKAQDEVLLPRNTRWLTTGYETDGSGITCICLERFS